MMRYVVTESSSDAIVLRTILAMLGLDAVRVIEAGGKSSAKSLGTSLALDGRRPVAVVVDAQTSDAESIAEQLATFQDLQPPSLPEGACRLFLAKPTLGAELFPDARTFASMFGLHLDANQKRTFEESWKVGFLPFLHKAGTEAAVISVRFDKQTPVDRFDSHLVRDIAMFLRRSPVESEQPKRIIRGLERASI